MLNVNPMRVRANMMGVGFICFLLFVGEQDMTITREIAKTTLTLDHLMANGILAIILGIMGCYFLVTSTRGRFQRKTLKELQQMDPYQFESYVGGVLRTHGYRHVKVTARSNDGGKDIVCYDRAGRKCVVEVKRYADKRLIGRPMIQKLHSCMIHEKAPKAIFITTSDFNTNAIQYARGKNIELNNGKQFVGMIK